MAFRPRAGLSAAQPSGEAPTIRLFIVFVSLLLGSARAAVVQVEDAANVPADWSDRPASTTCGSLRSGVYRLISPTAGGTLADQTGRIRIDAVSGAITRTDGSVGKLEARGPCSFVDIDGAGYSVDYVVSQAGVLAGRVSINGGTSFRFAFGFPEQVHRIDALNGTWSTLGLREAQGAFTVAAGSWSFDAAGALTVLLECGDPATWATDRCAAPASGRSDVPARLVADPAGGFTSRSGDAVHRVFLFQAAHGPPMLVWIAGDGSFLFGTRSQTLMIPPPGMPGSNWNLDVTGRLASATSTYVTSTETTTVAADRRSWIRRKSTAGLADEHLEEMLADSPRVGLATRPAGEAVTSAGGKARYNEFTGFALPGTGTGVAVLPRPKIFELRVIRP